MSAFAWVVTDQLGRDMFRTPSFDTTRHRHPTSHRFSPDFVWPLVPGWPVTSTYTPTGRPELQGFTVHEVTADNLGTFSVDPVGNVLGRGGIATIWEHLRRSAAPHKWDGMSEWSRGSYGLGTGAPVLLLLEIADADIVARYNTQSVVSWVWPRIQATSCMVRWCSSYEPEPELADLTEEAVELFDAFELARTTETWEAYAGTLDVANGVIVGGVQRAYLREVVGAAHSWLSGELS